VFPRACFHPQEWSLAVAALLDGCNKAAREELGGVGALREVRAGLGRCRQALAAGLGEELQRRAYAPAPAVWRGSQQLERGRRTSGAAAMDPAHSAPRPRRPGSIGGGVAALGGAGGGPPGHRRAATFSAGAFASLASRSALSDVDGHLYSPEAPLGTLVDCVAQLGGVPAALRAARARMPAQMRATIFAALESFPRARWLGDGASPGGGGGGASGGAAASTAAQAAAAQALLDHVFDACVASFRSVARLLQLLALARSPRASAGLEMLLAAEAEQGGAPAGVQQALGPAAARAECARAWECLQLECQALVAAVLDAPPPARPAQHGGPAASGAGWLASVGELERAEHAGSSPRGDTGGVEGDDDIGVLTFSLEEQAGEPLVPPDTAPDAAGAGAAAAPVSTDFKPAVTRTLGGHPGGPRLVTAAYGPVMRFTEAVERLLAGMEDGAAPPSSAAAGDNGARPSGLLQLQVPWRASHQSAAAAANGGGPASPSPAGGLRAYLESYLRMQFLPSVYVDFRARCSAVLEDGESFRPRPRLRGAYRPGAALLPAAAATAAMAEELLGWAAQVPPFAAHLSGVLENVLGRVLEACHVAAADAAGGAAAGRLAASPPLVQLMAKEPSAALLGSPGAFFVGRGGEPMESFVSSAIAAGFGAAAGFEEGAGRGVVARLLAGERPVPPSALLARSGGAAGGELQRLVALASLADSAEHVAEAIQRCAAAAAAAADGWEAGTPPSGPAAAAAASSSPTKADGGWQRQLTGRLRQWRGRASSREAGIVAAGLTHVADRYRSLAGQCARALRLDLMLTLIHHLEWLPRLGAGGAEAAEAEEHAAALALAVTRADEQLSAYLPPEARAYVFASLPATAVHVAVALLPEFASIDGACVARVCRVLSSLQPVLCAAGGGGGGGGRRPDAARQLEKAKLYYSLLTHSADSLVAAAAHKPRRFTPAEYAALLSANVPGRRVAPEHHARLQQALREAADRPAGGA
jgi:exocyst complex component 4